MTQEKRPPKGRILPKLESLDPLLRPEQSALLHLPAAVVGVAWQEAQSCADPECLACRLGRAMAWTTKAVQDIGLSLDVINGLLDMVPRDPDLGARFQGDLAYVSIHEMERVVGELAYWGKNVGYACGLKTTDELSEEVGMTIAQDDEGGIVAQVVRRQREGDGAGGEGKVN